jgi:hypothetical protein
MVATSTTAHQISHSHALPTPLLIFTCLSLPLSFIAGIMFVVNLAGATVSVTTTATLIYLVVYMVVALASFGYHAVVLAIARRHRVDSQTGHSCSSSATSITFAVLFTLLWISGFVATLVRGVKAIHSNSGPWQLPIVLMGVESVVMGCIAVLSIIGRRKLPDPE